MGKEKKNKQENESVGQNNGISIWVTVDPQSTHCQCNIM